MYVTRPLSLLRRHPELLNLAPQEGPNSGYLVLFDEECEKTTCFGLCKDKSIRSLPFPQNKNLTIYYSVGAGESGRTYYGDVLLIPVLDQPLCSNRYYVITRQGPDRVSSIEDDMGPCFCFTFTHDKKSRPFDPSDIYQQVEIIQEKKHHGFTAASMAVDEYPPLFLGKKYWQLYIGTPRHYQLDETSGLDSALRARLPGLDFSPSYSSSEALVVGKWYCPFVFVKELGGKLKEQMKKSMFYEMTLEQRWDKIFECDNVGNEIKEVCVDVFVNKEEACADGKEAICDWGHVDDGVNWYRSSSDCGDRGEDQSGRLLGLSALIMERMRWEQETVGFKVDEFERRVKVERAEEFDGKDGSEWRKFGCYVLVERFVLKKVDGTVLLNHDFKHTSHIRCKWE